MSIKKLAVFASGGTKNNEGGSGLEALIKYWKKIKKPNWEISLVISNNKNGGVKTIAKKYDLTFLYFDEPYNSKRYQEIISKYNIDFVSLSGWLKMVYGLNPKTTLNIHPALLNILNGEFGGKGMYGKNLHQKVIDYYKKGKIKNSGLTIHFVSNKYDEGKIIHTKKIKILPNDDWKTLSERIKKSEHTEYPKIIDKIINGISPKTNSKN